MNGHWPEPVVSTQVRDQLYHNTLYAAAAYCPRAQVLDWRCGRKCPTLPQAPFVVHHYAEYTPRGLAAYLGYQVDEAAETALVVLAFRGSSDIHSWAYDLKFAHLNHTYDGSRDARVHGGFYTGFQLLRDEFRIPWQKLIQHLATKAIRSVTILATGHSLGGALAVLQYLDFAQNPDDYFPQAWASQALISLNLTTVGEPRVGNRDFATLVYDTTMNQTLTRSPFPFKHLSVHRLTAHNDLIPNLPPTALGFYHHPYEYWLSYGVGSHLTQLYRCPDVVTKGNQTHIKENWLCVEGQPTPNMYAHMAVWDIAFGPVCL
ncbi:hypothetical protein H4R35_006148 [Dimargaris xerosporica]|nr:hypothetical protein H4R35_006148 [Dimargaris xerosporica]